MIVKTGDVTFTADTATDSNLTMDAATIVNELKAGKVVSIAASDAFEFMREIERHQIPTRGIRMVFTDKRCLMSEDGRIVES